MTRVAFLIASAVLMASSCGCGTKPSEANKEAGRMQIKLTSSAFCDGCAIPAKYTCDGANVSPPLFWDHVPTSTEAIALIVDDPDAPSKVWVHWVLFNLPAHVTELPEAIPADKVLSSGAVQGSNDSGKIGYAGPCPPSGNHRYYFKLYALDTKLDLEPGATKSQLLKAMEGHVLAEGQLMGTYSRK